MTTAASGKERLYYSISGLQLASATVRLAHLHFHLMGNLVFIQRVAGDARSPGAGRKRANQSGGTHSDVASPN